MSGSSPTGTSGATSVSANLLLIACMIAAAGAAIESVVVSVRGLLQAPSLPPKGPAVSITESMAVLARGNSPTSPVFAQQPNGTAEIAACVIAAILFVLVALIAWRLLRRQPFARSLSVALIAAGCVVAATAGVVTLNNPGSPTNGLTIALIVAGILLIVIGLVAEYGTRLQRDTEGLI